MIETYRGISTPEIHQDDALFIIADERVGWMTGYSDIAVMLQWQCKVDSLITRKLLEQKKISETDNGHACLECGAHLLDPVTHAAWHGYDLTL